MVPRCLSLTYTLYWRHKLRFFVHTFWHASLALPGAHAAAERPWASTSQGLPTCPHLGLAACPLMQVLRALPEGLDEVKKCRGVEALEMLRFNENSELNSMSNILLTQYFGGDQVMGD